MPKLGLKYRSQIFKGILEGAGQGCGAGAKGTFWAQVGAGAGLKPNKSLFYVFVSIFYKYFKFFFVFSYIINIRLNIKAFKH